MMESVMRDKRKHQDLETFPMNTIVWQYCMRSSASNDIDEFQTLCILSSQTFLW